jgi:glutamine amidotransferase
MTIIVDYGLGNLASVENMVRKAGGECTISSSPEEVASASRLILPGVGHFAKGMEQLRQRGLQEALDQAVQRDGKPILGICLGMQLMARSSEEGHAAGLGWFKADVVRFRSEAMHGAKVPHMGWSDITVKKDHPVLPLDGMEERFYFVHAYHMVCDEPADVLALCEHGYPFVCAVARKNIVGVQFHPEKSHRFGMALMERFIQWQPA